MRECAWDPTVVLKYTRICFGGSRCITRSKGVTETKKNRRNAPVLVYDDCAACQRFLFTASLIAPFASPIPFWTFPFASCAAPSVSSFASPVTFPTPSLTFPAAWLARPETLSLVLPICFTLETSGPRRYRSLNRRKRETFLSQLEIPSRV